MNKPTGKQLIEVAAKLLVRNTDWSQVQAIAEAKRLLETGEIEVRPASQRVPTVPALPAKVVHPVTKQAKKREPIPEHILLNMKRVKKAEDIRKATGGTLPTATFVQGGKVSPK